MTFWKLGKFRAPPTFIYLSYAFFFKNPDPRKQIILTSQCISNKNVYKLYLLILFSKHIVNKVFQLHLKEPFDLKKVDNNVM